MDGGTTAVEKPAKMNLTCRCFLPTATWQGEVASFDFVGFISVVDTF